MKDALETPEERSHTRLGYLGQPNPTKPLAWSLANHFISIGLQVHDKQVSDTIPNFPATTTAAKASKPVILGTLTDPETALTPSPCPEGVPIILDAPTEPEERALTPCTEEVLAALPTSPEALSPLDVQASDSSGTSAEGVEAEDSDLVCELTCLFNDLRPCPPKQEGTKATG